MPAEVRFDKTGKLTCMCWCETYVMVRRPGCYPMIMSMKDWRALPDTPPVQPDNDKEKACPAEARQN